MVFMIETRRTCSNLKGGNILPSGYFKIFILFLLKEKKKQSKEIYMKKYQKILHHPEGDSHMKFLTVVTVFHIDFVVVVVMELICILFALIFKRILSSYTPFITQDVELFC